MNAALRTAGCPAAERNILTKPTGGASPVSTPVGADSPVSSGGLRRPARPCLKGRAVPLNRRRKVRDGFLGREGRPSQSPVRKARRQTLYSCLVQPALEVDARFRNESLAPVSRASSAMSFTKNWNHSVASAVRPLDFRDHIAVGRPGDREVESSWEQPWIPRLLIRVALRRGHEKRLRPGKAARNTK